MNIAILGAGAMGLLYSCYLSKENKVFLLCRGEDKINAINKEGVTLEEADGTKTVYHPNAVPTKSTHLPPLDVVILFVKAGVSVSALEDHRHLFTENTLLLTLQNGSGHDETLSPFVTPDKLAIGISQDGSLLLGQNKIRHTGRGMTYFGLAQGGTSPILESLSKTCTSCGFQSEQSENIKWFVWEKLMINASSSAMSGVLGMPQGYCYTNKSAWAMIQALVAEMVEVANADGIPLDYPTQIKRLEDHLTTNPQGMPSITVDLKEGRITEVDSISGSVVKAGLRLHVPTPSHAMVVHLVHALEGKMSI